MGDLRGIDFVLEQEIRKDIERAERLDDSEARFWRCECGSMLFYVSPEVILCAGCDREYDP